MSIGVFRPVPRFTKYGLYSIENGIGDFAALEVSLCSAAALFCSV